MRRRDVTFGIALAASVFSDRSLATGALPSNNRTFLIGFLSARTGRSSTAFAGFTAALHDAGFIEDQNIKIINIETNGLPERIFASAHEIVQKNPDIIVASASIHVEALRDLNWTKPIVFFEVSDPVASGFVESLFRPGRNITGVGNNQRTAALKRVELLVEIVQHPKSIAYVSNKNNAVTLSVAEDIKYYLTSERIKAVPIEISTPGEIENMFVQPAAEGPVDAAIVLADPFALAHRADIASAAIRSKIPLMSSYREEVVDGGFVAYGTVIAESARLAGTYVARILSGASASELPVEYSDKYRLIINLKTANTLGINIPPSVLARVDEFLD